MVQRRHGDAVGGPYIAVHMRRRDFLYSHSDKVPSLETAARHIRSALARYNLTTVFVASDAPAEGLCHIVHVCLDCQGRFYVGVGGTDLLVAPDSKGNWKNFQMSLKKNSVTRKFIA